MGGERFLFPSLLLEEILQHINRFIIPELVFHNFGSSAPSCSIDTLVKIGERKDLLEELLIEVIKAEAEAGTVDTARMINIITLLRQLNIAPSERRSMPIVDAQAEIDQAKSKVELRSSEVEVETAELQLKTAKEAPPLAEQGLGGGGVAGVPGAGKATPNIPGSPPSKEDGNKFESSTKVVGESGVAWEKVVGAKGGIGWKSNRTGEVVYGPNPPT